MEELIIKSNRAIAGQELDFKRTLYTDIDWTNRLIGIMGSRGTGKTTILLQRLKEMVLPGIRFRCSKSDGQPAINC